MALQRCGHSAAMMFAVRAPQSQPARIALSIARASIRAMMSIATTACWAFRRFPPDRKRVGHQAMGAAIPLGLFEPPHR